MATRLSWRQALAWRMNRHFLLPVAKPTVPEVVDRLCGVQSQVASSAELAVRVRLRDSKPGEVGRALADGRLVKTWAMRGALHLLTPEHGGAFLSLIAAARSWHRPSWQRYFGMTPRQMDALRDAVREELDGKNLTREELVARIIARRGLGHVGEALRSGWGTLLKPLAWQGELVFGPSRGNRVTFMRPEAASTRWAGVPDADEAAQLVIAAYLGAHGPATLRNFDVWLAGGGFGKRKLQSWFASLGDRLAEVEVDGELAYLLAEHVDGVAATAPTKSIRLLPGFDQYVLGPGTADGHVTPASRRSAVSRQSGWIAPVVVHGGVVSGTWEVDHDGLNLSWFKEAGPVPRKAIEEEVARLISLLDSKLSRQITLI